MNVAEVVSQTLSPLEFHERTRLELLQMERRFAFSASSILAISVALIAFFTSDIPAWNWMYRAWMTSPDDSHGLLVPLFSAWLLWHRRSLLQNDELSVSWFAMTLGTALILAGIGIRCGGVYSRYISVQAFAIVPCIAGAIVFCGGWNAARWAWPAVLFLFFMIPLPAAIGGAMSEVLQKIATICSTYFLQMIGIPAVSEGNIIWLTDKSLGVAEACSGLRMLTSFFALTTGVAFVVERPLWEKLFICLSAPAIAILSNILRITGTAVAYEFGNEKMAELIFHDLAGWLMMPAGLLLLWIELFIVSKLFQDETQQRNSESALLA